MSSVSLEDIAKEITDVGEKIKTMKAAGGDKEILDATIQQLVTLKKQYADNNNGIGVDGKPYQEPLTKAQQKAKAKAEKGQVGSGPAEPETDPDSKGSQKKAAKKAEKAAKKTTYKTGGDGENGGGAPVDGPAVVTTTTTTAPPTTTKTAAKTNPVSSTATVTKANTTTSSNTKPIVTGAGIRPVPLQIIINPNVPLVERPVIALAVAVLTDTIIDYDITSDHRCRQTCLGSSSSNGGVIVGDVAMARYIARRFSYSYQNKQTGRSDLFPVEDTETIGLIDTWVDYAVSLQSLATTSQKLAAITLALEHALSDNQQQTYLVGTNLTLADLCLFGSIGFPTQATELAVCLQQLHPQAIAARRWITMIASHPALHEATQLAIGISTSTNNNTNEAIFDATNIVETLVTGMNPLEGAIPGRVVTRFPPEPSGYLHIGHAKAVLLNDYYAKRYKGRLLVRFDDTNPSKEKEEYQESIVQDLGKLGVKPDLVTYTSDYFKTIEGYAIYMIHNGLAYMDDTPQEQMKLERGERKESKHRNQSVEDGLKYFATMCSGSEEGGKWCLRAKIDMTSDNGTLRDPVLYRQNLQPHHRSGTTYKAYPTYDLACPIVDSIEGVTHALRTTEYDDRTAQYYWFQTVLPLRRVRMHTFSRVNFKNTVLSKRKLTWFVDSKTVSGWDDPRFPTVRGVVRRGIHIQALRNFMYAQGASKRVVLMDWMVFWSENKKEIDKIAKRFMAINVPGSKHSIELSITNGPSPTDNWSFVETPYHPKNPELGNRVVRIANSVYLESVDVEGITVGEDVVLLHWGVVKITEIVTTSDSTTKLVGTYIPNGDYKTVKRKLSWIANAPGSTIPVILTEFDNLISKDKLEEDDNFQDYINPHTIATTNVIGDVLLQTLRTNDVIQLERRGYYRVDRPYINPSKPLILFMIPDGKSKPMSGQAGQLAHR